MEANESQHGATVAVHRSPSGPSAGGRRRAWRLTVAAGVMVAAVASLNWTKVQTVAERVAVVASVEEANLRDTWAHYRFESEVDELTAQHKPSLTLATHDAARAVSTLWSCTKLVYYLASDAFRSKADAEAFLTRTAEPHLEAAMTSLGDDVNAAFQRLESHLDANSVRVNTRVEAFRANASARRETVIDSDAREKLRLAAEQLQEILKSNAGMVVVDAAEFKRLASKLSKQMTALARATFDRR